jgi:hypothetical protein
MAPHLRSVCHKLIAVLRLMNFQGGRRTQPRRINTNSDRPPQIHELEVKVQ